MKYASHHHMKQSGLSAVEMLITIVVAAIFVLSFYVLFLAVNQSFAQTRNRAVANDLAYSYLRKYASGNAAPTWFDCDTTAGAGNTNDSTINSAATGQVLESGTLTDAATRLPAPITYSVKALAIYGCSGTNGTKPIRVEATVIYGPSNTTIKHASFVGYQ